MASLEPAAHFFMLSYFIVFNNEMDAPLAIAFRICDKIKSMKIGLEDAYVRLLT